MLNETVVMVPEKGQYVHRRGGLENSRIFALLLWCDGSRSHYYYFCDEWLPAKT